MSEHCMPENLKEFLPDISRESFFIFIINL